MERPFDSKNEIFKKLSTQKDVFEDCPAKGRFEKWKWKRMLVEIKLKILRPDYGSKFLDFKTKNVLKNFKPRENKKWTSLTNRHWAKTQNLITNQKQT